MTFYGTRVALFCVTGAAVMGPGVLSGPPKDYVSTNELQAAKPARTLLACVRCSSLRLFCYMHTKSRVDAQVRLLCPSVARQPGYFNKYMRVHQVCLSQRTRVALSKQRGQFPTIPRVPFLWLVYSLPIMEVGPRTLKSGAMQRY